MSFLKALRGKNSPKQKRATPESEVAPQPPVKQVQYEDPWNMTTVAPEAVVELLNCCVTEIKNRGKERFFDYILLYTKLDGATDSNKIL